MESLRALAAKAPANLTVVLPGFLDSARQAVFLFDAFVMPSRYEGYGLVLAEAMTTGVPVVVNPVDSLPELCRFYRNHAMADFESPERKAETAAILAESVCRPKCSPQVISRKDEMADRYIRLYENLLGTRRKKKKN